jgi:CBS-domain-containing membrane protein
MQRDVKTCRADDTLHTAAQVMWDHDCGCAPVVDRDGHVVGMLTDRDICMAAYTRGMPLDGVEVQDAMSHGVSACQPQDTLADAERMMRDNQVHRLPVVDAGGRIVGIVSLNDLAQEASRETLARKRAISFGEVGETLAAVCRPRSARSVNVAA